MEKNGVNKNVAWKDKIKILDFNLIESDCQWTDADGAYATRGAALLELPVHGLLWGVAIQKPVTRAVTTKQRVRLTFICCSLSRKKTRNANVLHKFTFIPIFFCIVFLAFHFLICFTVYLPFVYSTLWPLVCERRFINKHYLLTVIQFKVSKLGKHFWNNMCWTSQITFIHICCIFFYCISFSYFSV